MNKLKSLITLGVSFALTSCAVVTMLLTDPAEAPTQSVQRTDEEAKKVEAVNAKSAKANEEVKEVQKQREEKKAESEQDDKGGGKN